MPQNIITAGNATSAFSQAAGDDGTFKIVVGPNGSQVDGISVDATGQPTFKKPPKSTDAASMVRLNTANGYGSTNTAIRRFTNVVTNQGTDITYADSATLGSSFTINTAGVYSITYVDNFTSAQFLGVSKNTTQPTINIVSLTNLSEILTYDTAPASGQSGNAKWTGYLEAGSVIRPHGNAIGAATGTSPQLFTIVRVA